MKKEIVELFAGVGGFRLGFDRLQSDWETVWFSQWEPGSKTQWAHECYVSHFGDSLDLAGEYHTGDDISIVNKENIPNHTLLVGGFPCQDYSVARSLSGSKGIEGIKGVLWWQIVEVLKAKNTPFCIFENVDRLLKSPAKQRGRDFGVMLACLNNLGYYVEWRVVNAAQYGAAQRRRRVFIFACKKDTNYYRNLDINPNNIISETGFMAKSFPVKTIYDIKKNENQLADNLLEISDNFKFNFEKAGFMDKGIIYTTKIVEQEIKPISLGEILQRDVDESFYITDDKIEKWKYLKGAKKINRTSVNGHEYVFSEGAISFPDSLDKPGRTMLTSESTLNRSTHVICDPETKRLRTLTPIEAERLQGFDDNWTANMPNRMRFFCMGNALVVPMITRMGRILDTIIEEE